MKIFKCPLALLVVIFLLSTLEIEAQPNKKLSPALTNFLNTEFMVRFHDLAIEAEAAAKHIQENQGQFSERDYQKLRTYYDQTAQRANKILVGVKNDFLDKKKLKMITKYPEMYSDGLKSKMTDMSDFYSKTFQQTLADAQVFEEDGSAILLLITEVIGLTKGLSGYIKDIKREARHYNEDYLRKSLLIPYGWKYWDEIAGGTSRYNAASSEPERYERTNRDNEFDDINSRIGRVGERVQEARGKDPKTNDNYNNNDSWSDDTTTNEDTSNDWDNWEEETTTDDNTDDWGDWEEETNDDTSDDDDWDDWGDGDGTSNDKKGNLKRDDDSTKNDNPFIFEKWNEKAPNKNTKSKSNVKGKQKKKIKPDGKR